MLEEEAQYSARQDKSVRFFDSYPRFLDTSGTAATGPRRLNLRYDAIFAANRDIFHRARVLDIASHDGRWSFAALKSGARHVIGVEARSELIASARDTFSLYGVDSGSYRFVRGDVFDVLARERFRVDVVLCLGFFYHTTRHTELLAMIRDLRPKQLIMDTAVVNHGQPLVRIASERVDKQQNAYRMPGSGSKNALVGRPSPPALRLMLRAHDFEVDETFDWAGFLAERGGARGMKDYAEGRRETVRCRHRSTTASANGASGNGDRRVRVASQSLHRAVRSVRRRAR